jgi:hypothetical protein
VAVAALAGLGLAGCPTVPGGGWSDAEYDAGFLVGFATDAEYWQGYADSYDTRDLGPIYYSGGEIPYVESPAYDAGYWDGVWYAYNDGYFVAYDYAFTIGFSEGYDVAFAPNWPDFLAVDEHFDYLDGGFSDGYNDGFSEGRIFGAYDWEFGLPFDWLDALLDYREGTDLEMGGVSTGDLGPVYLYEYGTDPNEFAKQAGPARTPRAGGNPSVRIPAGDPAKRLAGAAKQETPALSYRPLPADVTNDLSVRPEISPRSDRALTLTDSWLDRVNAYRSAIGSKSTAQRN